jgi:hypothetical protein
VIGLSVIYFQKKKKKKKKKLRNKQMCFYPPAKLSEKEKHYIFIHYIIVLINPLPSVFYREDLYLLHKSFVRRSGFISRNQHTPCT